MKIEINGKEYDFRVTGTVGLMYLAERALGTAFDQTSNYHMMVLYYCCLQVSNKGRDIPDMVDFIASMTREKVRKITEYFDAEWHRMEGEQKKEEDVQGED